MSTDFQIGDKVTVNVSPVFDGTIINAIAIGYAYWVRNDVTGDAQACYARVITKKPEEKGNETGY